MIGYTINPKILITAATLLAATLLFFTAEVLHATEAQSLPIISVESINISTDEPETQSVKTVSIGVQLNAPSAEAVTVQYRTSDITAEAGRDYTAARGTVTIPAGSTSASFSVRILNDNYVENLERFRLEIHSPTGAALGASLAQVNIVDQDESDPYNIIAPAEFRESWGSFDVIVETGNTHPVEFEVVWEIYVLPSSTLSSNDYGGVVQAVRFEPGVSRVSFPVTITDDMTDEGNESLTLQLELSSPNERLILGATLGTTTILDDDPTPPTNFQIIDTLGNDSDGYDARVQWDHNQEDDGYVLERRRGNSGNWLCILAAPYGPGSTTTVTTVRGGKLTPASNWRFRVRSLNPQALSYIDDVTCDENASYGYVHSTTPREGYNKSTALNAGPFEIPVADSGIPAPTGLATTGTPEHGMVELTWDTPAPGGDEVGFALYRKWQGNSNAPNLCLLWRQSQTMTTYTDRAAAAYDTNDNKNKYTYSLYALSKDDETTGGNGCDGDEPDDSQKAELQLTLTTASHISRNSDGDFEHANPPVPTGLTARPRWVYRSDTQSRMGIRWEQTADAPGYRVRFRKAGDTAWKLHSAKVTPEFKRDQGNNDDYNNCTGVPKFQNETEAAEGVGVDQGNIPGTQVNQKVKVWCYRENGKELITSAANWPPMWEASGISDASPKASRRLLILEEGQRYEIQVASCTTQSCAATGDWSASRFATAAREP